MITRMAVEARRRASELAVVQTLKHRGEMSIMKSLSECRRVYGSVWMNEAIASGQLVGVVTGKRTMYSIEDIIALQELQLQEADGQINV